MVSPPIFPGRGRRIFPRERDLLIAVATDGGCAFVLLVVSGLFLEITKRKIISAIIPTKSNINIRKLTDFLLMHK